MAERNGIVPEDPIDDLGVELEIDLDEDWPARDQAEDGVPDHPPTGFIIVGQ